MCWAVGSAWFVLVLSFGPSIGEQLGDVWCQVSWQIGMLPTNLSGFMCHLFVLDFVSKYLCQQHVLTFPVTCLLTAVPKQVDLITDLLGATHYVCNTPSVRFAWQRLLQPCDSTSLGYSSLDGRN